MAFMINNDRAYCTIPEAIRYSGISRTMLYGYLKDGKLPAKKAGKHTIISVRDLDKLLASLPAWKPRP